MRYSIIEKGGRLSKIIRDDCRLNKTHSLEASEGMNICDQIAPNNSKHNANR